MNPRTLLQVISAGIRDAFSGFLSPGAGETAAVMVFAVAITYMFAFGVLLLLGKIGYWFYPLIFVLVVIGLSSAVCTVGSVLFGVIGDFAHRNPGPIAKLIGFVSVIIVLLLPVAILYYWNNIPGV